MIPLRSAVYAAALPARVQRHCQHDRVGRPAPSLGPWAPPGRPPAPQDQRQHRLRGGSPRSTHHPPHGHRRHRAASTTSTSSKGRAAATRAAEACWRRGQRLLNAARRWRVVAEIVDVEIPDGAEDRLVACGSLIRAITRLACRSAACATCADRQIGLDPARWSSRRSDLRPIHRPPPRCIAYLGAVADHAPSSPSSVVDRAQAICGVALNRRRPRDPKADRDHAPSAAPHLSAADDDDVHPRSLPLSRRTPPARTSDWTAPWSG